MSSRTTRNSCCCSPWYSSQGTSRASAYPCGLRNHHLSCCTNALLQVFAATPSLGSLLNSWTAVEKLGREAQNVPRQLQRTLKAMKSNQAHHAPHWDFLQCLHENHIRFYVQHDADEVFLAILNLVHQQMTDKPLADKIRELFMLNVESSVHCNECTYVDSHTTYLLSLPLPLREEGNTLEDCLRSFFRVHELADENKVYCQRCGEKQSSKQGFKLASLPPVLCLHLKRFRCTDGYTKKLFCQVHFQEILNLKQILHKDHTSNDEMLQSVDLYELYAVIVHSGTATFGHYTAYVRHKTDQPWYYADDYRVHQATWDDVKKTYGGSREQTAYMLLYKRVGLDAEEHVSGDGNKLRRSWE